MNTRTGGQVWVAQAQCDYARMLWSAAIPATPTMPPSRHGLPQDSPRLGSAGLLSKAEALTRAM
jgi:hypothetical protein